MCSVCGCSNGNTKINGKDINHDHSHDHEHPHDHDHTHQHDHAYPHTHDHSHDDEVAQHSHAPGISQGRMISIEKDIMAKNDGYASKNREYFHQRGILALNLVSSPGSGKTTLLTKTIENMKAEVSISVIEGDQQTSNDAMRIRSAGAKAVQINTGKGCHLDAHMVGHALGDLEAEDGSIIFIENVGNLVCPAGFDLGEAHKVVILSVTEGEDKPLKYPDMFYAADIMLLNKSDLLPYLDFDVTKCVENAKKVNPKIKIITLSATKGEGMNGWYKWIMATHQMAQISNIPSGESINETQAL